MGVFSINSYSLMPKTSVSFSLYLSYGVRLAPLKPLLNRPQL